MATATETRELWLTAYTPHIHLEGDFLPLRYTAHNCGEPVEASSKIWQHPTAQNDFSGWAAECRIDARHGEAVLTFTEFNWDVFNAKDGALPSKFDRFNCWAGFWEVTLPTFADAEAMAQFAWKRWRETGRFSAAGLERLDVDNMGN